MFVAEVATMFRLRSFCAALAVSAAIAAHPAVAGADVVLDWNVIALKTTAAAPFNPPVETRNLAIVHAAMFDAVNSITREFHRYAVRVHAPEWASPEAAAVAAAHSTLVQLYPAQQSTLDAAYGTALGHIPDGAGRASGIDVGERVAERLLTLRASDGAAAAVDADYTPGDRPGDWNPTPPAFLPALDPAWGSVQPFFLRNASQFRPAPPPSLNSMRYARDFDEIKAIGSAASVMRSQDQTNLARFWISTASQNWNPAAREVAIAQRLTLSQNARAFALLNLAGADAFIAAWDAKFAYSQWRPVTAIRAAGADGNAATDADPLWTPLLVTPPFPDYIAGHTTYAGAAQVVLEHLFGRRPGAIITLTSSTAPGVVETYTTFKDIADGVVEARVWGGIHWRTSSVRGRILGEEIGRYAARHLLRRRDGDDDRDDRDR
jgi:hypothetical protein